MTKKNNENQNKNNGKQGVLMQGKDTHTHTLALRWFYVAKNGPIKIKLELAGNPAFNAVCVRRSDLLLADKLPN